MERMDGGSFEIAMKRGDIRKQVAVSNGTHGTFTNYFSVFFN
jgi:hypothetical protein